MLTMGIKPIRMCVFLLKVLNGQALRKCTVKLNNNFNECYIDIKKHFVIWPTKFIQSQNICHAIFFFFLLCMRHAIKGEIAHKFN